MEKLNWRDLMVTDHEEATPTGRLGDIVNEAELSGLKNIVVGDEGELGEWQDYFISAPGETPDWDTPRAEVCWDGFEQAYSACMTRLEQS